MTTLHKLFALPLPMTVLLLACGGSRSGPAVPGTENPTAAAGPANDADMAVVQRLTAARCEQERECKNIGAGEKFSTPAICNESIHASIANDLNSYKCPRGLDSEAVDRCLAAIKSEECGHPFDTLTRYDKCRTGAICMN